MSDHDSFNANSGNTFTISCELLCLLRWLIDNEPEKLQKMVAKALATGLKEEISRAEIRLKNHPEDPAHHEMQQSIVDFFNLMESCLVIELTNKLNQQAAAQNLMTAIDHIDTTACDVETVRHSLDRATTQAELNPNKSPHEILYKELLRRWKPSRKKQMMH